MEKHNIVCDKCGYEEGWGEGKGFSKATVTFSNGNSPIILDLCPVCTSLFQEWRKEKVWKGTK
jgi:hypothetical protein